MLSRLLRPDVDRLVTAAIVLAIMLAMTCFSMVERAGRKADKAKAEQQITLLKTEIRERDAAIELLKRQSAAQITRVEAASNHAARLRQTATVAAAKTLTVPVAGDCAEAAAWGAAQGKAVAIAWEAH